MVTIVKYLVLFIAASLILPYFGCHIFTSAPPPEDTVATETRSPSRSLAGRAPAAIRDTAREEETLPVENEDRDQAAPAQPQTGSLNDIQQLLGE